MKTVYKYQIHTGSESQVSVSRGARVVEVAEQDGVLCLWMEQNPLEVQEIRRFLAVYTGSMVPDHYQYAGTAHMFGMVFHVFEIVP